MVETTDKAWDGSASRWPTAQAFCKSCLINENEGDSANWTKDNCHLPIKEPSGEINTNAVSSAVGYLGKLQVPGAAKKRAAATLRGLYKNVLKRPIPPTLDDY